MSVHWGDVPEWVAALGTVGAFWAGYLLLRREANRDEQRHQDDRRDQATRITIWRAEQPRDPLFPEMPPATVAASRRAVTEPMLVVDNASDRPIFDVFVSFVDGDSEPGAAGGEVAEPTYLGALAPRTTREVAIPDSAEARARGTVVGIVRFTDSAGVPWVREPRGELHDLRAENALDVDLEGGLLRRPHRWRL